jgi:hypothetical protein
MSGKKTPSFIVSFIIIFIVVIICNFTISFIRNYRAIQEVYAQGANCNVLLGPEGKICFQLKDNERTEYLNKYKTIEDCNQAEKKNLCVLLIARYTYNSSVCYTNLTGFTDREYCIYHMATFLRNSSLCSDVRRDCQYLCELDVNSTIDSYLKGYNSVIMNDACFPDSSENRCSFRLCKVND